MRSGPKIEIQFMGFWGFTELKSEQKQPFYASLKSNSNVLVFAENILFYYSRELVDYNLLF